MEVLKVVNQAFSNKTILVTGATGFVGKVLLEKILRDVPDCAKIILLMRGSREHPKAAERFKHDVLTSKLFEPLRAALGERFAEVIASKVECVAGEITEPYFGLKNADFDALAARVDLVINSAASVNFREPLDDAIKINTLSLRTVVDFVEKAGTIPLVHVSTCYVNGLNKGLMLEQSVTPAGKKVAKDKKGHYQILPLIDKLQTRIEELRAKYSGEELTEKLIDLGIKTAHDYGWNDTYTFTKWMGEELLRQELTDNSLTILRPSIVESAIAEPIEGWVEGVKVADALILAFARRRFSFFPARPAGVIDIIPVDLVVNGIILSATEALTAPVAQRIYQCCSGEQNPLTIAECIDIIVRELREHWQKYPRLTKNRPPRKRLSAVRRSTFLAAMASMQSFVKARARLKHDDADVANQLKSFEVTLKLSTIYSFYTNPRYVFSNRQLLDLQTRLAGDNAQGCCISATQFDWQGYLGGSHMRGLEQFGLSRK